MVLNFTNYVKQKNLLNIFDFKEGKKFSLEEICSFREYFDECDINKDGTIDFNEFEILLTELNVPVEEIEKAVNK
jgi:Ca2+-binding EF-hand superfamily protein